MRLHALHYNNFGPFKGEQVIDFVESEGVTIVYGDNNLGKTTLLNSVRWLFVNKFFERTGGERDDRALINSEAIDEAKDGETKASVAARVTWNDEDYNITRSLALDGDKLLSRLDVIRGSDALSAEDSHDVLRQMMPEEIQQFFLFDAEALNRYEDLLHDPNAGEELKKAIERILGVPVLTNAVDDLRTLIDKHTKVIAKLETKNAVAQNARDAIAQLQPIMDKRDDDITKMTDDLEKLDGEKSDIEKKMASSDTAIKLLERHRAEREKYDAAEIAHQEALAAFQDAAPDAWSAMLTPKLDGTLHELRDRAEQLEEQRLSDTRTQIIAELRGELQDTGVCPCCGLSSDYSSDEDIPGESVALDELFEVRSRISTLETIFDPAGAARLDERSQTLQAAYMRVHDAKNDLKNASEAVDGLEEKGLADLPKQLGNTKQQISNLRDNLAIARTDRDNDADQVSKLAAVIAEHGGPEGAAATRRQKLLTDLRELFASAITEYREQLKDRVEKEATEVFLKLRSEDEFTGLSINDDYGLSILHESGALEPHRSAGYEHIVALALVAALQRCAPVHGPIFMDMPFARLDPSHKTQTLKALTDIADQVILLVHDGEVGSKMATSVLGSSLVCERRLTKKTAHHTKIMKLES